MQRRRTAARVSRAMSRGRAEGGGCGVEGVVGNDGAGGEGVGEEEEDEGEEAREECSCAE